MENLAHTWDQWTKAIHHWLWDPPPAAGQSWSVANIAKYIIRVTWLTLERYRTLRLSTHASGLAFFLMMSLVPLLAFLFLLLKLFQITDLVRPYLLRIISGGNLALVDQISTYIENTQTGQLGVVGTLLLGVVGFLVLQRVKTTLNLVWQVERRPGYQYRIVEYIAIVVVAPFLLVATFSLTTFLEGAEQIQLLSSSGALGFSGLTLTKLSGHMVMWLLVFYAYGILPDTRVSWGPALAGSLVAGSLLRLVEGAYLVSLLKVGRYDMVYGALALLPFMMIWFYLAWTVFLLGAQLSFVIQNYALSVERHRTAGQFATTTPFAIVVVLVSILRCMKETGVAPKTRAIRRKSGLPRGVVTDAITRLEDARLLTQVFDRHGEYVPQEVLEQKTVREVLERVGMLPRFLEPPAGWSDKIGEELMQLFREAGDGMAKRLEKLTLGELALTEEQ